MMLQGGLMMLRGVQKLCQSIRCANYLLLATLLLVWVTSLLGVSRPTLANAQPPTQTQGMQGTSVVPRLTPAPTPTNAPFAVDRKDDGGADPSSFACTDAPEDCSISGAIDAANTAPGEDTIVFDPTIFAAPGPHTINISNALPDLGGNITIQGPGAGVLSFTRDRNANEDVRIFTISNDTDSGPTVTLSGLTIDGNDTGVAGAIYNDHGVLTLIGCTVKNNFAYSAAGIYNDGSGGGSASLNLLNCTLSGNGCIPGGRSGGAAIFNYGYQGSATAKLMSCTLRSNFTYRGPGGAIYNGTDATATLSNCSLSNNSAGDSGGAIANDGVLTLTHCTIVNNDVSNDANGGGVDNTGTLILTNCTLSNNSILGFMGEPAAMGSGGGLANLGIATVRNCTFSDNAAVAGAAIYNATVFSRTATLMIGNTILKRGASGENLANNDGTVTSEGHNLSSDDAAAILNQPTDINNIMPQLGPPANNGGPTMTYALLPGSPAINRGNDAIAPPTDQRGHARRGSSDIGAFEFDGIPPRVLRVDALIQKGMEGFTGNNIYQLIPHGAQVERQSVSAGGIATYRVKIENDGFTTRRIGVRAIESPGADISITYRQGARDITAALRSQDGYKTAPLAPGGHEIITVRMTATSGAAAGKSKSTTLKVYMGGTDRVTRDVVQASTRVAAGSAIPG